MGDIYLELAVANIYDRQRQQEIPFLVDTRASCSWIPHEIAERLGIIPAGTVSLELADGEIKEFPYGFCLFDFGGETIVANIVIGPAGSEPLVGNHVLQDLRLVIDMDKHTISRSRALRAKKGSGRHLSFFLDAGRDRC